MSGSLTLVVVGLSRWDSSWVISVIASAKLGVVSGRMDGCRAMFLVSGTSSMSSGRCPAVEGSSGMRDRVAGMV